MFGAVMKNMIKQIESVMYGTGEKNSLLASLLSVISTGYSGLVGTREFLYKKRIFKSGKLPCTVISIGNITVGGTGKTPMTIYLAELIKDFGLRVAVVSRGYKGRAEKKGGIVSNGKKIYMDAADAGDEPCMIAARLKGVPVVIGGDRFAAGSMAVKQFDPDVIILDDAFQHLKIQRDINLVLLDNNLPFGNRRMLPRGILREPVSALKRGDALLLTRADYEINGLPEDLNEIARGIPVFRSSHMPYLNTVVKCGTSEAALKTQLKDYQGLNILKHKELFLFSGIARNRDFYNSVNSIEKNIKGFLEFPDHYIYTNNDIKRIIQSAIESGADCIVTTEKDYARMDREITWPLDLIVIGVEISLGKDKEAFSLFMKKRILRSLTD
jgi:tetraacyldisaccharide 4'-kinase